MKNSKQFDLVVGVVLGVAVGLLLLVAVSLSAIYFFPRYFDVWDRGAPPVTNSANSNVK